MHPRHPVVKVVWNKNRKVAGHQIQGGEDICIYMHIFMCIYTYICIYICIYIHIYICIYLYVYTYTYV